MEGTQVMYLGNIKATRIFEMLKNVGSLLKESLLLENFWIISKWLLYENRQQFESINLASNASLTALTVGTNTQSVTDHSNYY